MKYRKKPVVIEAVRLDFDRWPEIEAFLGADYAPGKCEVSEHAFELRIRTLEGTMLARPGDYIIRGIAGELYPCREDVFVATYEAV